MCCSAGRKQLQRHMHGIHWGYWILFKQQAYNNQSIKALTPIQFTALISPPPQNSLSSTFTFRSYSGLENVTVDASKYEPGDLKCFHTAIVNFKSFLLGTYHGSCGDYQPYLDEFCFRFNLFDSTGDSFPTNYLPNSPAWWLHFVLCQTKPIPILKIDHCTPLSILTPSS